MKLTFEIHGTHEGDHHALPKIKLTRAQHWLPKAQQYVAWKRHVCAALSEALKKAPQQYNAQGDLIVSAYPQEITGRKQIEIPKATHCRMDIVISFKNGRHADPENIFGSIADAIFHNDARLRGSFDFLENQPTAKVTVTITAELEKNLTAKRGTI